VAVASPVDVAINPNNTAQRLILWGNGRIDPVGGAVPVVGQANWYARIDQPVAVALHITDWATSAGYILTANGSIHEFNGAPDIGNGIIAGVPYVSGQKRYIDWAWNTSGNGQGYVLDVYGKLWPFGGAPSPARTGARWTWPAARKLKMQFTPDVRAITMDLYGGLHGDFAQPNALAPGGYWKGLDYSRDFVITTWADAPAGYQLDLFGGVHNIGSAPDVHGYPYRPGADVARLLFVVSSADPIQLGEVWSGGQQFEWVSSTPPTVVAGGSDPVSPAVSVTGTTRPVLSWTYSDPQADSQAAWELFVFTQAWVDGHSMTDPAVWAGDALVAESGINPATRGLASPVDLPNGGYRMYVRAKDTAGQWSAWSNHGWSQAVPLPTTPTGLTATADEGSFSVALSVSATTGEAADLIRFESSDDGGVTWMPVRGADAVTLVATTTATDWDPPLGVTRAYRAVAYAVDPAVASAPSATATATVTTLDYVVTATDDPTLGGRLRVQEPVEWVRPVTAGVFQGLGADFATVVKDGRPKGRRSTVHVFTEDAAAWTAVKGLAESGSTLVYRDPFGSVRYCELVGDWSAALFPGAATRHLHTTDLPLVEVRPPHLAV
jgi:hypothetical protein